MIVATLFSKFKDYGNIPSPFVMLVAMLFQKFKDDGN